RTQHRLQAGLKKRNRTRGIGGRFPYCLVRQCGIGVAQLPPEVQEFLLVMLDRSPYAVDGAAGQVPLQYLRIVAAAEEEAMVGGEQQGADAAVAVTLQREPFAAGGEVP